MACKRMLFGPLCVGKDDTEVSMSGLDGGQNRAVLWVNCSTTVSLLDDARLQLRKR